MNKKMIGFLAIAVFVIGGGVILLKSDPVSNGSNLNKQNNSINVVNSNTNMTDNTTTAGSTPASNIVKNPTPATPSPKPTKVNPAPTGFTLSDVENHASSSSCWTAVNGNVYDVTSFISQHPGGSRAILSLCGIDGSDAFNGQHGGQRRPASELASFKIGTLLPQ
jgi:cytochrome b involved in lipid metabolism